MHTGWFRIQCQAVQYQDKIIMNLVWIVNETWQSGLVWSRLWSKSASQIKTIDTLVVIQTKPGVAWHGILGLSVQIGEYISLKRVTFYV